MSQYKPCCYNTLQLEMLLPITYLRQQKAISFRIMSGDISKISFGRFCFVVIKQNQTT